MKMIKRLLFLFLLGTLPFTGNAQELIAQVKINRDKIQGTTTVFETLEKALEKYEEDE